MEQPIYKMHEAGTDRSKKVGQIAYDLHQVVKGHSTVDVMPAIQKLVCGIIWAKRNEQMSFDDCLRGFIVALETNADIWKSLRGESPE